MIIPWRRQRTRFQPSARDYQDWFALGGEFFEQIVTAIYRRTVRRGDHVIDVGANHGRHTLPLARCVGWQGRVTAVEALPHLASKLARRTRWLPQVAVVNKALSREEGKTSFAWVAQDEGMSGIQQRRLPSGEETVAEIIEVPKTTLDHLLSNEMRRVSFMKIDVECGELDVICGGLATIARDKPLIAFENGGGDDAALYGYTRGDFFAVFDRLDYALFDLFGRPLTEELWANDQRPWYVIAAPEDSADVRMIETELPVLIGSIKTVHR